MISIEKAIIIYMGLGCIYALLGIFTLDENDKVFKRSIWNHIFTIMIVVIIWLPYFTIRMMTKLSK